VKRNRRRPKVKVTGGGWGVVGHAGARLLADIADELGLTDAMSAAMAPTKQRNRGVDRGEVLVDLAVMLADGGEAISDLAVLRDQPSLFVMSPRTRPRGGRWTRSTTPHWSASRRHGPRRVPRRGRPAPTRGPM